MISAALPPLTSYPSLQPQGKESLANSTDKPNELDKSASDKPNESTEKSTKPSNAAEGIKELDLREQRMVTQLQQRDREVHAHEAAHLAAAGSLAMGGANFSYQTGPDGRRYATGGEVQIDVSAVPGDPQATLAKSEQIRRAAMAPAQPSAQDVSVAANAGRMSAEARVEIMQLRLNSNESEGDANSRSDAISHYQNNATAPPENNLNTYA